MRHLHLHRLLAGLLCVLNAWGCTSGSVDAGEGEGEGEGEAAEGEGEAAEGEGEAAEGEGEGEGEAAEGEGEGEGEAVSTCASSADAVACPYTTVTLRAGGLDRDVHVAVPAGEAPSTGWKTVVYFQGSLASAELAFAANTDDAFGQFELAQTVEALLDAGFAVVAPEVLGDGSTYWQTNIAPAATVWSGSYDDSLMLELLAQFDDDNGDFGHIDTDKLYAMGISSGGFMTSRMAVSYAGRFKALAIHSGGYAWCSAACLLPSMPDNHPPTLFVHGADDLIVSPAIMQMYADALNDDGVEIDVQLVEGGAHAWLAPAITAMPAWFLAH